MKCEDCCHAEMCKWIDELEGRGCDFLSQEPCDDAISRDYLFRVLDDFCGHDRTATITLDTLADLVYELPSVNPQPCDDVVSRQAVIKLFNGNIGSESALILHKVKQLPSVTQKSGHWLRVTTVNPKEFCNRCSECGYEQFYAERYKFCPNCGAKMVEPQERSDEV